MCLSLDWSTGITIPGCVFRLISWVRSACLLDRGLAGSNGSSSYNNIILKNVVNRTLFVHQQEHYG